MLNGEGFILCPSATYTERGFYRVRNCCLARALENQIYVAECHDAGTLSVPIDDRRMVSNGTLVEAETGDRELVLVGEIDLDSLHRSRELSKASILKNRCPETYKEYHMLL